MLNFGELITCNFIVNFHFKKIYFTKILNQKLYVILVTSPLISLSPSLSYHSPIGSHNSILSLKNNRSILVVVWFEIVRKLQVNDSYKGIISKTIILSRLDLCMLSYRIRCN